MTSPTKSKGPLIISNPPRRLPPSAVKHQAQTYHLAPCCAQSLFTNYHTYSLHIHNSDLYQYIFVYGAPARRIGVSNNTKAPRYIVALLPSCTNHQMLPCHQSSSLSSSLHQSQPNYLHPTAMVHVAKSRDIISASLVSSSFGMCLGETRLSKHTFVMTRSYAATSVFGGPFIMPRCGLLRPPDPPSPSSS